MFAKIYNKFLNKGKDKKFRIGHSSRLIIMSHIIISF